MCFDHDSRPPIRPIAGGALDSQEVTLTAADGNQLTAFEARAALSSGASIVILPDVRGLHTFYFELVLRFAENGVDAVGIDWFGRTAGPGRREDGFEYMPHVERTTWDGVSADIAAGAAHARTLRPDSLASLFTIGFCFGGRMSFLSPTLGLGLAGAIASTGRPPDRAGPDRRHRPTSQIGSSRDTRPVRRRRPRHSARCGAGVRRGSRAGRGRAPPHHLSEHATQLLRSQGRRVRGRVRAGPGRSPRLDPRPHLGTTSPRELSAWRASRR